MATRTCEKCGWVMDLRDPSSRCPICKTKFKTGICAICGEFVEYYRDNREVCKRCYDTVTRTPRDNWNMNRRRREFYEEWIENISKIPKSYPTLTEAQWIEAVKHFGKCALCEDDAIEARGYFIPFNRGGRYCDWNIVPICYNCATEIRINPNYFLYRRPVGLQKVVDYLEEKINAAIAKSSNAVQQTNYNDDGAK